MASAGQNDEMLRAMLGALPLFGVSMVLMQGYLVCPWAPAVRENRQEES